MRWINFFITLRNHSFSIFSMYTKYFWKINIFYPLIRTSNVDVPGIVAQENFFRGDYGRAKIARKLLLRKNKLMIRSTINIHFATCFYLLHNKLKK